MNRDDGESNSPAAKRNVGMRFGLKAVLILVTAASVWLAVVSNRARRQKKTVEQVLDLGGHVAYDYQLDSDFQWRKDPQLPAPSWLIKIVGEDYARRVVIVNLDDGSDPTNDDLALIRRLPDLRQLTVANRKRVSDTGLQHLGDLRHLEVFAASGTKIRGPGLSHLSAYEKLQGLALERTPLTDSGLAHIGKIESLEWLLISDTNITDEGLSHLRHLKRLKDLQIRNTGVTDAGLEHLKDMPNLEKVLLSGTLTTRRAREKLQSQLKTRIAAKRP